MEKKITKKDRFTLMLNKYPLDEDDRNLLLHEIELLEKKASKDRKPTAAQKANIELKDTIYELMETDRLYTCTEVAKILSEQTGTDYTVNKMSALLGQMVGENRAERVQEKRKTYFRKK